MSRRRRDNLIYALRGTEREDAQERHFGGFRLARRLGRCGLHGPKLRAQISIIDRLSCTPFNRPYVRPQKSSARTVTRTSSYEPYKTKSPPYGQYSGVLHFIFMSVARGGCCPQQLPRCAHLCALRGRRGRGRADRPATPTATPVDRNFPKTDG